MHQSIHAAPLPLPFSKHAPTHEQTVTCLVRNKKPRAAITRQALLPLSLSFRLLPPTHLVAEIFCDTPKNPVQATP
jgi:hypothetical protein